MATPQELESLVVKVLGDASQYNKTMDAVIAKAQMTAKKVEKVGKKLTTMVTVPLAGIGAASTAAFGAFDQAMTESTSIMDVTAEQAEQMRKQALELGSQGAKGPAELARSYFFLASAGLDAEQAIGALPVVQTFATAGAFDMARATDLLTDAQSALGLSVDDAAQNVENMASLGDVLVKANTLANASVEQFSIALTSKAGAAAKSFSRSQEEVVAVLAAMADQGIKAELAGNAYDRILRLLAKSARDNEKAHKKFGFSVFDAEGRMRNMADIMAQLERITGDMSDETKAATLEMLGFEARVQGVILPLLGTSGAIEEYQGKLEDAGGTTQKVADKQMMSFSNQLKITKNLLTTVAIEIGEILAPKILELNNIIRDGLKWWRDLDDVTKNLVVNYAKIAAAVGPVLLTVGKAGGAASSLAGGLMAIGRAHPVLMAIVAAVTALGAAIAGAWWLWQNFDLVSLFKEWSQVIVRFLTVLPHNFAVAINTVVRMLTVLIGWISKQFIRLWEYIFSFEFQLQVAIMFETWVDATKKFIEMSLRAFVTLFKEIAKAHMDIVVSGFELGFKVLTGQISIEDALKEAGRRGIEAAKKGFERISKELKPFMDQVKKDFNDGFEAESLNDALGKVWDEQKEKFKPFMDEVKKVPDEIEVINITMTELKETTAMVTKEAKKLNEEKKKAVKLDTVALGLVEGRSVESAAVTRQLAVRRPVGEAVVAAASNDEKIQEEQLGTLQDIKKEIADIDVGIILEEAGLAEAFPT